MKDTNETNQCHPDDCHDVIKMTRIIIHHRDEISTLPLFRRKDVTVVTISNKPCSVAVAVIVHHFDLFLEAHNTNS